MCAHAQPVLPPQGSPNAWASLPRSGECVCTCTSVWAQACVCLVRRWEVYSEVLSEGVCLLGVFPSGGSYSEFLWFRAEEGHLCLLQDGEQNGTVLWLSG